jgi:hypothetical protein
MSIVLEEKKKEYYRQYRIDNKEVLKEYITQYNIANKEQIKICRMMKFTCCCGREVSQGLVKQHERSDYHYRHIIAMLKKKLYS